MGNGQRDRRGEDQVAKKGETFRLEFSGRQQPTHHGSTCAIYGTFWVPMVGKQRIALISTLQDKESGHVAKVCTDGFRSSCGSVMPIKDNHVNNHVHRSVLSTLGRDTCARVKSELLHPDCSQKTLDHSSHVCCKAYTAPSTPFISERCMARLHSKDRMPHCLSLTLIYPIPTFNMSSVRWSSFALCVDLLGWAPTADPSCAALIRDAGLVGLRTCGAPERVVLW
ncbi:hypothetical protein BDZ85DRAFT_136181 [Elsinoe ampelina]|uniref:Uncharacterized protein n=1 Tax=Elsinoe ampelina TaxID=302913 RepID=A0A6A6G8D1_9PEZI|nr:hypothetical protein BDZ85DRAFT_136181 [Elsinoe ampelina]